MDGADYADDVLNTAVGVDDHGVVLLDIYEAWCADELHFLVVI